MASSKKAGIRMVGFAGMVAVVLLVAACGSSKSSSSSKASSAPAPTKAASSSGTAVTISTKKGPMGTYLTDSSGRALYLWMADTKDKSSCSAACAKVWPPLTTAAAPKAAGSVAASDLGTVTRADGTMEITYKGHPLYYYAGDTGPATTKGQGSSNFGAKWWLVAPSGTAITAAASGQSSSGGSSSGGSSSGSGGGAWG